jgi:NitT/TauT family transport system permease protein
LIPAGGFIPFLNLPLTVQGAVIFCFTFFLLLSPQLFSVLDLCLNKSRRHAFGGGWAALAGVIVETVLSILLAPLFITALGVGIASKIIIVFISAVFPVLFNTYAGITTVDARLVEAVRAFGGTPRQVFFKVTLPSSVPMIMTGLRLSVGRAIVGAIVSEFFGSRAGIGYLISAASEAFRTADAFVGVALLAIGGYVTFELLKYAERKIAPWYESKV